MVVLLNDGSPKEGSPKERFFKPGGTYFEACAKGQLLLLLEPTEQTYVAPFIQAATKETLRHKAEAKHFDYAKLPTDSQRYRFVALNEIGRLLVSD